MEKEKLIRTITIVHGEVQKSDYRGRVIGIAKKMGITGTVQNLINGNVKIVAEGEKSDIDWFCNKIDIKDFLINVTKVDREKDSEIGDDEREYEDFYKIVGEGETDERLDRAAELLKDLVTAMGNGFEKTDERTDRLVKIVEDMGNGSKDQREYIKRIDEHNLKLEKILEKLTET